MEGFDNQDQNNSPVFSNNGGSPEYMNPVFMPSQQVPEQPKKKFKLWPVIVALVALVLIGGGVILFLMRDVIANSMAKSSKTPEEYLAYVVDKQPWDTLNKEYEEAYTQVSSLGNTRMDGVIRFNMSDDMLETVESAIEEAMSSSSYYYYYSPQDDIDLRLDAWQDIAFEFENVRADNGLSAMQGIRIKDKDYLLSLEELYDTDKSTAYVRCPQLNEDYAAIKLANILDDDELEMVNGIIDSGKNGLSVLPTAKTMDEMRQRYMSAILEQIDDVDMSDDTLVVNSQEMKCTVLSFTLDEDMQKNICQAFIDTVRDDSDLEDFFYNLVKESGKGMNMDMDPDELWEDLMKELDKAEQRLDDIEIDVEPDVLIYVDNKGNIVGFSIEDSKDVLLLGYIRKGTKLWFEFSATSGKKDLFSFTGEGKAGVSGVDMDCLLAVNDDEEFELPFTLEDFSSKGGTFRMDLEPICDMILDRPHNKDAEDLLDILDGELVISSQRNDMESKGSVAIEDGSETKVGISYDVKLGKGDEIEFPANKECVKISSAIELMPYLGDCDMNKLADNLEKLGLPKEYADEVRDSADMLKYY